MDGARAEIYIDTGDELRNFNIYSKLKSRENDISTSFPGKLIWQDLPEKRACRICVQYNDFGLNDYEHWEGIINLLGDSIAALIRVFKPLIDTVMRNI